MFGRLAFLLVSLCEIWYGFFGLILPEPNDSHYFTSIIVRLIPPHIYYIIFIIFTILFYATYHLNKNKKIPMHLSVFLGLMWLLSIFGVIDTLYFTTTLPLLFFMFLIRILIAMMIEAERYGKH